MFCYNCGTDCKEDRFCSNCGCRVGKPEERVRIYPDPPLGIYSCLGGFLEVLPDGIRKKWAEKGLYNNMAVYEHFVSYCNISEVYLSPKMALQCRYLTIREKGGIGNVPKTSGEAEFDPASIRIPEIDHIIFQKIYAFLERCAQINKEQNT